METSVLEIHMDMPTDPTLPFFSYGIFRPGQLAFLQVSGLTEKRDPDTVKGWSLWLRDGMSVLVPAKLAGDSVSGVVLTFERGHELIAYKNICDMEPQYHYAWTEPVVTQNGVKANCLMEKTYHSQTNMVPGLAELLHFDLERDPFHEKALKYMNGERPSLPDTFMGWDSLFRLEMLYMLLWSSIERYLSQRYRLNGDVSDKLRLMSDDEFLRGQLASARIQRRSVRRSDNPSFMRIPDAEHTHDLLLYYYQIRCNLVHHGKEGNDYDLLYNAFDVLLLAFQKTVEHAYKESRVVTHASR
jgi:hypothetical protein